MRSCKYTSNVVKSLTYLMSSEKEELEECLRQLADIEEQLKESPGDHTLVELKTELEDVIKLLQESTSIPEDLGKNSTTPSPPPAAEQPESPSKVIQSPPKNGTDSREYSPKPTFAVGDTILAFTVDKQWRKAKITSVTGSRANPLYTVKFVAENAVETLVSDKIRPVPGREQMPPKPPPPGRTATPSAATSLSTPATKVAKDGREGASKPMPVKMSTTKLLNQGQAKWQDFQRKGVKLGVRKVHSLGDKSIFRTDSKPPSTPAKRPGFKKLG
jgi:survival-of-motor-neuron-related-splicing factor 30